MNGEYGKIWNETVVAYFEGLTALSPGKMETNNENQSQDIDNGLLDFEAMWSCR
jgi:hypothetical protein